MKRILPVLLMLTGCISTAPTSNQLATNAKKCAAYGYRPGTDKYADCQMALAQQSEQSNDNARASLHAMFGGMEEAGNSQPAPVIYNPYPPVQRVQIVQPVPTLTQTVNRPPIQRPVY